MTYCEEHEREDCDACADETRLEDEYDELYCALQAIIAQLIATELPIEHVRAVVNKARSNLSSLGLIRATALTPGLDRVVFGIVHELIVDTKERAKHRQEPETDG